MYNNGHNDVKKDDYVVFNAVFKAFQNATDNTIERVIYDKFFKLFNDLKSYQVVPFTFEQATELNDFLEIDEPLVCTFSMLQLERKALTLAGIMEATVTLLIDLYDGKATRGNPGTKEAIQELNEKFSKTTEGTASHTLKERLNALQKGKTAGPDKTERSWGQVAMMAAAGVLALYLGNRFVVQPALQWYRARGTQV